MRIKCYCLGCPHLAYPRTPARFRLPCASLYPALPQMEVHNRLAPVLRLSCHHALYIRVSFVTTGMSSTSQLSRCTLITKRIRFWTLCTTVTRTCTGMSTCCNSQVSMLACQDRRKSSLHLRLTSSLSLRGHAELPQEACARHPVKVSLLRGESLPYESLVVACAWQVGVRHSARASTRDSRSELCYDGQIRSDQAALYL